MTDSKPFAAIARAPLPGEPYAGPTDELGYALDEPAPAVATGDDRFSPDVVLLLKGLQSIGFEAVIVLEHGVIYGEQISRLDLSTDWAIAQAGTGRRLAYIKYDLRSSEGTRAEWRARAAELGCAVVFLERGAMHRQEVWDRIRAALESGGLGSPPWEPPGEEVANTRREQPAERRTEQADTPAGGPENAFETHPGDAAPSAARRGLVREEQELDGLVAPAKQPAAPQPAAPLPLALTGERSPGHALRSGDSDPDMRSRAGRELARRRWGRRGS